MERKYKARWRRSYSGAQQKQFSRVSQVVKAVEKRVDDGELLGNVFADLTQYYGRAGDNIARLVGLCQLKGWLLTKKRKRRSSEQEESLSP
jgi:hypothetical protein